MGEARMTRSPSAPAKTLGPPPSLEDALSFLQCTLIARRTSTTPEAISWTQYDVLEMLRINGNMRPSTLSDSLGISRASVSKALRVLKDLELIAQAALGEDRREQTTTLTHQGHLFLARAAKGRRENARAALSVLSEEEQDAFAEMCQRVATAVTGLLHERPDARG